MQLTIVVSGLNKDSAPGSVRSSGAAPGVGEEHGGVWSLGRSSQWIPCRLGTVHFHRDCDGERGSGCRTSGGADR